MTRDRNLSMVSTGLFVSEFFHPWYRAKRLATLCFLLLSFCGESLQDSPGKWTVFWTCTYMHALA